jgi:hypothetical protein
MSRLNRRIEIATTRQADGSGEARAALEDDFHHFRVTMRHRDGVVGEVTAEQPRFPTGGCEGAAPRLSELVGMKLDPFSGAALIHTDARFQCTHLIDLAGLAIAAAAQGIARRRYDVEVPDAVNGRTSPRVFRDGVRVLEWQIENDTILGPDPFTGRSMGLGFSAFAREQLTLDDAEAALILRRGIMVGFGRLISAGLITPKSPRMPIGACWAFQPERAHEAVVLDTKLDFSDRPEALTQDDQDWIAFA